MGRRGNCRGDAVGQSYFSSLQNGRIRKRIYKTSELERADIFDCIEVLYNRPAVTVTLAASVPGPLNGPRREASACPRYRGKSTSCLPRCGMRGSVPQVWNEGVRAPDVLRILPARPRVGSCSGRIFG